MRTLRCLDGGRGSDTRSDNQVLKRGFYVELRLSISLDK